MEFDGMIGLRPDDTLVYRNFMWRQLCDSTALDQLEGARFIAEVAATSSSS